MSSVDEMAAKMAAHIADKAGKTVHEWVWRLPNRWMQKLLPG